ncbi:MAG: radical SAM protein [Mariprofundales bacterium]|nr:radical SAM protein [Mariprofundales bacterium]
MQACADGMRLYRNGYPPLLFTGTMADALTALADGCDSASLRGRLQLLARANPALEGLAQATMAVDRHGLVVGKSLGLLFIELTLRCNERCLHCYAGSDPERVEMLTKAQVERVLDQARQLGRPRVQFTGGDPLIHPDLPELVAYAVALDFAEVEIYTNGLLLHDALLAQLRPFAPKFAFSLYSHNGAHHDAITGVPGSHVRTVAAMRRALAANLRVRASMILMGPNQMDAEATRAFLIELGVDAGAIHVDRVRAIGRGVAQAMAPSPSDFSPPVFLPPKASRAGKLCVSADGQLYPCIFSRQVSLGSIHQGTISEQLAGSILPSPPDGSRWRDCQQQLTCADCQLTAYLLKGREDEK